MRSQLNLAIFVAVCTVPPVFAAHQPLNVWHGLTLDVSTVEDVNATLGKPAKEGGAHLILLPIQDTFKKGDAIKSLSYNNIAGVKRADLFFEQDTLVAIQLEPAERVDAAALPHLYGIDFEYHATAPIGVPEATYALVAVNDDATVLADVKNPILMRGNIRPEEWPGKVIRIALLSHALDRDDDHRGANVLQ